MNLLVPAALAFSAIIPIIVLLYFMRPKRQERVIGSTLLWQQALQDLQASRPWQRLRITPLLLLQLLAAIIIVLVLARPAIFWNSPITGDTVIILQASASMQATDVSPNRFEHAKNTIADFIDTLGPNDRLSLISMARTPQVLAASSQDKPQLRTALQHATVTNQNADLEQALSLATSLIAGHANAQVLIIGDGHVTSADQTISLPFPVHYLRIGTDAPNAALLALSSRAIHGHLIAFAQVANYSHQVRSIPVALYADNKLVGIQTATLSAGATGNIQWSTLTPSVHLLHAHLDIQDVMTVDHDAWAIVGGSQHGKVLLVTKGNSFLETALRLQPNIDLFETTPTHYVSTSSYDLTVFDGYAPPSFPHNAIFFINPPAGVYPFGTVGQAIRISHISVGNDTQNILHEVDLSSIHVLRASHQIKTTTWVQPLITAPEAPLLMAGENNSQRIAVLGFDLHDSDFPLQPAFPILMHNLTTWFLPPPVAGDGQVAPGTPVSIQAWPGADKVTISSPDQHVTTVGPPITPFAETNQTGIYQIAQQVHGKSLYGAFAVNLFDATQSNLAPTKTLPIVHSTDFAQGGTMVSHELREIWPWIAALLLLVLCCEWWLFSRNYRRQSTIAASHKQTTASNTRAHSLPIPFIKRAQDQFEIRYRKAKKHFLKVSRRAKARLVKQTPKGGKHANI